MIIGDARLSTLIRETRLTGQAVLLRLFVSNAVCEQIEVLSDNILDIHKSRSNKMSVTLFELGRRASMDL